MKIQELARQKFQEKQKELDAYGVKQKSGRERRARQYVAKTYGEEFAARATYEDNIVQLDGLTLRHGRGNTMKSSLALSGICSECGDQAWSEDFFNAADLGKLLEEFEPCYDHKLICPDRLAVSSPSAGERFLELLHEVVWEARQEQ